MMPPASRRAAGRALVAAVALLAALPSRARAQGAASTLVPEPVPPAWAAAATTVGLHVVEAGVRARLGHHPVRAALWRGALGGGVTEAGRQWIAGGPRQALWVGPALAAVGGRIAADAGAARPLLREGTLPVGPLLVSWARREDGWRVRPRLSLFTTLATANALAQGARPDWRASAQLGTVVLRSPALTLRSRATCDACRGSFARTTASMVLLSSSDGLYYDREHTLRHETVHLAQQATDVALHAGPASDAIASHVWGAGRLTRGWLAWDLALPLRMLDEGVGLAAGDPRLDWYELDARATVRGRSCLKAWSVDCPR